MSTFQDNLKKYRDRLGITAKDFAAQIGIPYTTYTAYENQGREPKYDTLCKIAAALNVSIDELLGYKVDKLKYWYEKFPRMPLNANAMGNDIVISFIDSSGSHTQNKPIIKLSKSAFIEAMEDIERETLKATNASYENNFELFTMRYFLNRAAWGEFFDIIDKDSLNKNTSNHPKDDTTNNK